MTAFLQYGCSDKSAEMAANDARVVVGDETDARAKVTSDAFGVRLEPPGPGWKLLGTAHARQLAGGAVLGALGPDTLAAVLMVEPAPSADLDRIAEERAVSILGEPPDFDAIDVADGEGRRYGVSDGALRRAGAFWLRGDTFYELRVWGHGDRVDDSVGQLAHKLSFTEPSGDAPGSDTARRGTDWLLADGVYETAHLRLPVPSNTRLVVGPELSRRDPWADVLVVGTRQFFELTITSEPSTTLLPPSPLPGEPNGSANHETLGSPITLSLRRDGERRIAVGSKCSDGWCHVLSLRFRGEEVPADAISVMKALAVPTKEQALAVEKALAEPTPPSCSIGVDYAIRGRRLRSFGHGFTLDAPPPWRIYGGLRATRRVGAAAAVMDARRWGLEAAIVVDEAVGDDPDAHHAAAIDALHQRGAFPPAATGAWSKATPMGDARISEGPGSAGLHFFVATLGLGGTGIQMIVWGRGDNMAAHGKDIRALVSGLSARVDKAVETPPGGYVDHRLGISASMPVGWRMQNDTSGALERNGAFITWQRNGGVAGVLAMCVPATMSPGWAERFVEQRLRERLGPLARGAAVDGSAAVAGRDANGVRWASSLQHIEVVVTSRGNTVVAIAAADKSSEALTHATAGFSFVD